jgi:tetratricopeptide (TPR) repeat protein
MATYAASAASRAAEWKSAAIKVVSAAGVLAALLALYAHEIKVETQVRELVAGPQISQTRRAGGAQGALAKDTPAGWLQAESRLQQALEMQPSNPVALASLAVAQQLLAADGFADRGAKADEATARAEAKDVSLAERHQARALGLLRAGRAVDAENYLRPLVEKFPGHWELWDALGLAQRAAGKLGDARQSLRRAMEIGWRSPRAVADYAVLLLEDGSAAEAAQSFDRALQANADHLRSLAGKARALLALHASGTAVDLMPARKLIDDVLERSAGELSPALRALALASRAELALAQRDLAAAIRDAGAAVKEHPVSAAALRARALALAADPRQRDGAIAAFKEAIAKDPYDVSIYFDGAAALAAAGVEGSAEKLLGAYAALLPKGARYHLALARLRLAKDDPKGAAEALAAAEADADPSSASIKASVYFEQGRLAQRQRDAKGAQKAYQRALALRDDFPEVYRQMGALYLDARNVDDGMSSFVEALRRYKAARVPEAQLEPFYKEVHAQLMKAKERKKADLWLREARAMR